MCLCLPQQNGSLAAGPIANRQFVRERFAVLGNEPVGNTPDEYAAQIKADLAQWGVIVKRAGVKIE